MRIKIRQFIKQRGALVVVAVAVLLALISIIPMMNKQDSVEKLTTLNNQVTDLERAKELITGKQKIEVSGVEINNPTRYGKPTNMYGDISLVKTDSFEIMQTQGIFLISIYSSPFENVRKQAESVFLKTLGISEEEACKLSVDITTPRFANPDESVNEYKLSFCN